MKAAGVTVKSYQTPDINKISRETREAGAKLLAHSTARKNSVEF